MTIFKKILYLGFAVMMAVSMFSCEREESEDYVDVMEEQAREHYAEGRRLFLTCDPNNYPEALDQFQRALGYDEDHAGALAGWAEATSMYFGFFLPEDKFQEAYMKAQRSIRLDPKSDMGYRAMADLYRHHRNPETGEFDTGFGRDVIERALAINPDSAENLYVKGSLFLAEDPARARDILIRGRQANPNLGKTYFNLASAYQHLADRIIAEYKDDPEALKQRREEINKNYGQAAELLSTYQELVPGDIGGYCAQGIIYVRMNEFDKAEKAFQKTVSVHPDPDPSLIRWTMLAYVHLAQIEEDQRQDLEGAESYLELALKQVPRNLEVLHHLYRINKLQEDTEKTADYEKMIKEIVEAQKNRMRQMQEQQEKKREAERPQTEDSSTASP